MAKTLDQIARPPQVGELAYRAIRDFLSDGELAPGERIVEATITAKLGTSRTPVREALARLASEGLVDASQHGYRVPSVGPEEIYNMCQVRSLLEPEAARQAARNRDPQVLEEMRLALCASEEAHESNNIDGVVSANTKYRSAWLRMIDNPVLLEALAKAMSSLQLIRRRTMSDSVLRGFIMQQQRGLFEKIEAGDVAGAANWQYEKLWQFYELILRRLYPEATPKQYAGGF